MFPTHVGIARGACESARDSLHVPYACGDCASAPLPVAVEYRCSLRMWGLRGRLIGSCSRTVMFPTHVGIAREGIHPPSRLGHVPYACGDCAFTEARILDPSLCSLRMWGLRGNAGNRQPRAAMFPTHVGIARA